jgi:hypothetical protein
MMKSCSKQVLWGSRTQFGSVINYITRQTNKQSPWLSVRKRTILTERPPRPAKLVSASAGRGWFVANAKDSYGRWSRFSRPEPLLFFHASPQLSSRGGVDPVLDKIFLWKSGSTENRTRNLWICSQELGPLDHWGGPNTSALKLRYRIGSYHDQASYTWNARKQIITAVEILRYTILTLWPLVCKRTIPTERPTLVDEI